MGGRPGICASLSIWGWLLPAAPILGYGRLPGMLPGSTACHLGYRRWHKISVLIGTVYRGHKNCNKPLFLDNPAKHFCRGHPTCRFGVRSSNRGAKVSNLKSCRVFSSGKRLSPPCVSCPGAFRNKLCYEANVGTTRQTKQKSDFW